MNLLTQCIGANKRALQEIAKACGVTYQAVKKWEDAGRLPQSDHTGITDYAGKIAALPPEVIGKGITREKLLEWSRKGWQAAA